ncbi:gliding motility-associated C-terminal domain-containing protein [Sinomicrobium oceani]|uniref:Gliding motility-associated C-terminal domain-containing protein n=2 Tax=Sinomicrobium oceani TaxID=1150368 RepID=A0A1K1NR96_9FLAO|nr:gliding motility-associated C-terminal domain-containing protein [Sinomicrobium oceani]
MPMDQKLPHFTKIYIGFLFFFISVGGSFSYAQTLYKPTLQFENPCASAGFNTYKIGFSWDPPMVDASNEFILELSDPNGDFSNSTELTRITDKNGSFNFEIQFGFPVTIAGDEYRVRVRSTSPQRTGSPSDRFSAYYRNVLSPLTINVINGSVEGNVALCNGGTYELSVHNYPDENSYIWYRNGVEIPGETTVSLEVSQGGSYYAEVNYGEYCSSDTSSNLVNVTLGAALEVNINNGDNALEVCPDDEPRLTADFDDTSAMYTWFKDAEQIGAAGYRPELALDMPDPSGEYYLRVENSGGCVTESNRVTVSLPYVSVTTDAPQEVVLFPGNDISVNVSTTANAPEYTWYKNDVAIAGEEAASLVISQPGIYKVKVKQTSGCELEVFSQEIRVSEPQNFTLIIAPGESYSPCENASATLVLSGIFAETIDGSSVDVYEEYRNVFNYQWYRNNNYLDGRTGTSLTINQPSDNGLYTLKATLGDEVMVSNTIDLKIRLEETVSIEASDDILCGGAITINITTGTGNTDYTYAWYKDGEKISENTTALNIEEEGTYRLGVSAYGCTVFSNELIIHPFDESVIEVDSPERIILPEGTSKTITVSGGDSYAWYNSENELISDIASITLYEEGKFYLLAYLGNCEVYREFTVAFQDMYIVPNVVSPNNDGINDYWVLPNIYAFNPDVEVVILNAEGKIVLRTTEYQNNWPESSLTYSLNKPVFYYRILKDGLEVIRQGTITLIR